MKTIVFGSVALVALIAGPAMAADMAVKAPLYKAPPPVYVFSWTGCYVGANGGGLWARKEWINQDPIVAPVGVSYGTHNVSSWLGGVQAGCNYQFAGGWVVGIQGDYDWTDAKGDNVNAIFPFLRDQSRIKSLASVTGRVGYAWDRFLGYVKGGGAWERDDYALLSVTGVTLGTASETRGGWTVGVGGEYAFTDWLSGFAEYDYYNFGTRTNTGVCITAAGCNLEVTSTRFDVKETKSVFKVGLNFRWGAGPVVARY